MRFDVGLDMPLIGAVSKNPSQQHAYGPQLGLIKELQTTLLQSFQPYRLKALHSLNRTLLMFNLYCASRSSRMRYTRPGTLSRLKVAQIPDRSIQLVGRDGPPIHLGGIRFCGIVPQLCNCCSVTFGTVPGDRKHSKQGYLSIWYTNLNITS